MDLSKVIIQNKHNNNDRYRWTRSKEFGVRSMLSGRFYRSKSARDLGDKAFIKYNYLGKKVGFLKNPAIGAENIKKVDVFDRAIGRKIPEYTEIRSLLQSAVMAKVWENDNMRTILHGVENNGISKRNGVPVVKKRFCRRVSVGEEHLLEKSGVQAINFA